MRLGLAFDAKGLGAGEFLALAQLFLGHLRTSGFEISPNGLEGQRHAGCRSMGRMFARLVGQIKHLQALGAAGPAQGAGVRGNNRPWEGIFPVRLRPGWAMHHAVHDGAGWCPNLGCGSCKGGMDCAANPFGDGLFGLPRCAFYGLQILRPEAHRNDPALCLALWQLGASNFRLLGHPLRS